MKTKADKKPTPKFRHSHGGAITIPKWNRKQYDALIYFAGITRQLENPLNQIGWS